MVSISPPDHAVGVTSDTNIVITFSTRMDQATTQAAYQSPELPSNAAVLIWDASGTVLTVIPNAPLVYATGPDPVSVPAKRYAIFVSTAAVAENGKHLAATFMSSFQTRRLIQLGILPVEDLTGTSTSDPVGGNGGTVVIVGDSVHNEITKGLFTFDISALPANGIQIESATLKLNVDNIFGRVFAVLGAVTVDQTTFATRAEAFAAASRRSLGPVSIRSREDAGSKTIAALAAVVDDYANRAALGNLSQYRLSTAVGTNFDGDADFYQFNQLHAELAIDYSLE